MTTKIITFIYLGLLSFILNLSAHASDFTLIKTHYIHQPLFMQGLQFDHQTGKLLYSSGLYGQSQIGYLDLLSGMPYHAQSLPSNLFAEGIAITPHGVWQVTWREKIAILWTLPKLQPQYITNITTEGWGLAYDFDRNIMWLSDGTATLQMRDAQNFEKIGEISVQQDNKPIKHINELEYANGHIYANLWGSNTIVKINPITAKVVKTYDFTTLVSPLNLQKPEYVLNGIAHLNDDRFIITGKYFPVAWEIQLNE
ncbi:glutaminyl-peptide cyclotransferase [Moraxella nasicaprae]|uniref:Glutaminyl-peptide cyclotransferase n=1 Tax=Moraxella nasicaprae TaxID=2904122 RepID=A0ABY6F3I7_9GAMM|nr:glutaminyl-peptide cyclotransferase [Moraxella nasicaprae]UXZ04648.1 glutaminyl-peptide cyclotransferase [Moraxella nasicaprae]